MVEGRRRRPPGASGHLDRARGSGAASRRGRQQCGVSRGGRRRALRVQAVRGRRTPTGQARIRRPTAAAGGRAGCCAEPLWLDESCSVVPYPAVAYRWLRGTPLGPNPTEQQLAALIDSIQRLHDIKPGDAGDVGLRDAWLHWFDFTQYLDELKALLTEYGAWLVGADAQGGQLRRRLARLVEDCSAFVAGSQADPSRSACRCAVPRRSKHGERPVVRRRQASMGGLGIQRLGRPRARPGGPAVARGFGRAQFGRARPVARQLPPAGRDTGFEERLAVWDRLIATRWAFLILRWLWSAHEGPDRERLTQPANDVTALRVRLVRFIERAEQVLFGSTTACGGRDRRWLDRSRSRSGRRGKCSAGLACPGRSESSACTHTTTSGGWRATPGRSS